MGSSRHRCRRVGFRATEWTSFDCWGGRLRYRRRRRSPSTTPSAVRELRSGKMASIGARMRFPAATWNSINSSIRASRQDREPE